MTLARRSRALIAVALVAGAGLALAVPSSGASSATWTQEQPATSPPGRAFAAMAYDPNHNQVVLYGGYVTPGPNNQNFLQDTWTWDGSTWTFHDVASPGPRAYAAMAFDGTRVILFGGYNGQVLGDTWGWDGTQWTRLSESGPPPRQPGGMAYDKARGKVVLFGGAIAGKPLDETWEWDGASWTQMNPVHNPGAQNEQTMAYDPSSQDVVLLHRGTSAFETWTWDGADWTQLGPAHQPPSRTSPSMTTDFVTGRVLLFGGTIQGAGNCGSTGDYQYFDCPANDTWTWDGTDWTNADPTDAPGPRDAATLAPNVAPTTDPSSEQSVVLFGGRGNGYSNETWTFEPATAAVTTTSSSSSSTSTTTTAVTTTTSTTVPPPLAPSVDGVDPNVGSTRGGEVVKVMGSGFTDAIRVHFGNGALYALECPSSACDVKSDNEIDVSTPAHDAGTVHVVVFGPGGSSAATDADQFTFVDSGAVAADPAGRDTGLGQPPSQQPIQVSPPGGNVTGGPVTNSALGSTLGSQSSGFVASGDLSASSAAVGGAGSNTFVPTAPSGSSSATPANLTGVGPPQPPMSPNPAGLPTAVAGPAGRSVSDAAPYYSMVRGDSSVSAAPTFLALTATVAGFVCFGVAARRNRRQPRPAPRRAI